MHEVPEKVGAGMTDPYARRALYPCGQAESIA